MTSVEINELEEIQASIHGLAENGVNLHRKGRRFLMKDDLVRLKKGGTTKKPYHVYLFNDMILFAEKVTSKKVVTLKYVTHMNIKDIFFIECADSKDKYAFGILHKDEKKKMKFAAKNYFQKVTWKLSIEQQIEKYCPTDTTFAGGSESMVTFGSPRGSWGSSYMGDFLGFGSSLGSHSDLEVSDDDRSCVSNDSPNIFSHIAKQDDWSSTNSGDEGTEDTDGNKSEEEDFEGECRSMQSEDGTLIITAACLNTVVWWLIYYGDFNDPILIRTFFYSCTTFTTPPELFNNLLQIYDLAVPVPQVLTLRYSLCDTRKRVTFFLKIWLEYFFERDFLPNKRLYDQLLTFFFELQKNGQNQEANILKLTIIRVNKKRLIKRGMNRFSYMMTPVTPKHSKAQHNSQPIPAPMPQVETKLIEWNVTAVAEQFALIEFALFKAVDLKEISNMAWKSTQPRKTALNVVNLFNRFDMVSQWTATEVVMAQSARQRITIIEKLIQLAQKCAELRNFNSLMEIVAGLNRGSVRRMKKTWEGVAHASRENLHALNSLVDSVQNYRTYRELLKKTILPCLPYFGIFLRDLTFTDVGNPTKIGEQLINFERIRITSRILKDIQMFQRTGYSFDEDETLQPLLRRLLAMPEEMLYKHSQTIEQTSVVPSSPSPLSV